MAQPEHREQKERLRERIDDLRKVKLLDILDLQGSQVEKFFSVYNSYEDKFHAAKEAIDKSSRALQGAIGNGESDAELAKLTAALRDRIRDLEKIIEARFDDSKSVLTVKQYAQYVVFEARFREELQRMILDRARSMRRSR